MAVEVENLGAQTVLDERREPTKVKLHRGEGRLRPTAQMESGIAPAASVVGGNKTTSAMEGILETAACVSSDIFRLMLRRSSNATAPLHCPYSQLQNCLQP